jgi:predicted permease
LLYLDFLKYSSILIDIRISFTPYREFCMPGSFDEILTQSILILVSLILMGTFMRKIGVVKDEHGVFFARIVTDITLPALIFLAVSKHPVKLNQLLPPVVLISAEITSALLAWGAGTLLKLSKPQTGALILASMFGSSAFLGYAVIKDLFVDNSHVLAEAAIISELGVGLLIFTVGVGIAIHFGKNESTWQDMLKPVLNFFRSHIFFALITGLIAASIGLPKDNIFISSGIKFLQTIASANTLMVTMTIGIMLKFHELRKVIFIVTIACIIKLLVQPLLAGMGADLLHFSDTYRKVVVIEASMPSAALAAVFAKRYKCDGELASILVFATFISSIFTIITISLILF